MICDKAGAGDLQPVGLSVATLTTVRPSSPQQLAGREHKGIAGTTGCFGQLFFPRFKALHVCIAHVQCPRCAILDLGGYALWKVRGPNFGLG